MEAITELENKIAHISKRKYCFFTGRASTALFCYLTSQKKKDVEEYIIIPNILCNSVPNTILNAGYKPIFVDINLKNYTISSESLKTALDVCGSKVSGVIAPHLYGHTFDYESLLKMKEKYNFFLIEDAAQTIPDNSGKSMVGKIGDASLFSFGHTKPINGGGGGCILLDDLNIIKHCRIIEKKLPKFSKFHEQLAIQYNKLYYIIRDQSKKFPTFNNFKKVFPMVFKDLYNFQVSEKLKIKKLIKLLEQRNEIITMRKKKAKIYQKELNSSIISHPQYSKDTIPWRYTFMSEYKNELEIAPKIREIGIDVSPWYSRLDTWYNLTFEQKYIPLNNSIYFSEHVLNLWLDETHTIEQIKKNCRKINQLLL